MFFINKKIEKFKREYKEDRSYRWDINLSIFVLIFGIILLLLIWRG